VATTGADHAEALASEGDALAEATAATVEADLSGALTVAAGKALASVKQDAGGGVAESGMDAAAALVELAPALDAAQVRLAQTVRVRMEAAIMAGFRAEVRGQERTTPDAVKVVLAPNAAEDLAAALVSLPVLGHTSAATGAYQGQVWRYSAESSVGVAAATGTAAALIPGRQDAARIAGNKAGSAVSEAYHSGAGAARAAVGQALLRAVARA
jgi:hypothetical protein